MTVATLVAEIDVVGLASQIVDAVTPYGARERVLPPEIGQRLVTRRGAMTAACMRSLICPGVGEVRTLAVVGDTVLALQVVALPRADRDVGLFCAEAVVEQDSHASIDIHALAGPEAERAAGSAIRRAETRLAADGDAPLSMNRFSEMLTIAWNLHVYDMVLAPELRRQPADGHFTEISRWKEQAAHESALRPLLTETFGEEWTQRCLERHFFA